MPEPRFLTADDVLAIADEFFAALGYAPPVLRGGGRELLESAVHRARAFAFYEGAGLHAQAAALAAGIAESQVFTDGNKRVAFAVCVVFLRVNGHPLHRGAHETLADRIIALPDYQSRASAEAALASWLADHID